MVKNFQQLIEANIGIILLSTTYYNIFISIRVTATIRVTKNKN